jgi:hypothetical protein
MHYWDKIRKRTVHTQKMRTHITVVIFRVNLFGGSETLIYFHDFRGVTIDWGVDWILDLLTTFIHNSELQVISAVSLICILYKSKQHPLSLFQSPVSSTGFPWQRLLTVEIL